MIINGYIHGYMNTMIYYHLTIIVIIGNLQLNIYVPVLGLALWLWPILWILWIDFWGPSPCPGHPCSSLCENMSEIPVNSKNMLKKPWFFHGKIMNIIVLNGGLTLLTPHLFLCLWDGISLYSCTVPIWLWLFLIGQWWSSMGLWGAYLALQTSFSNGHSKIQNMNFREMRKSLSRGIML